MKVYLLTEADFERLHLMLREIPPNGIRVMSDAEQRAHDDAYRRFNYHVCTWEDSVKGAK